MKFLSKDDTKRTKDWPWKWADIIAKEGIYEWRDPYRTTNGRSIYVVLNGAADVLVISLARKTIGVCSKTWGGGSQDEFRALEKADLVIDLIE